MALTKAKKAEQIDKLAHELEGSTSAIVGTFAKLTVAQDFELRKVVRGAGGRYRVLKNKLAARASKGTKVELALQGLNSQPQSLNDTPRLGMNGKSPSMG